MHLCLCNTYVQCLCIQRRSSNPWDWSYMSHDIDTRILPLGEQLVLLTINLSLHPLYFHVYTSLKIKYSSRIVNTWKSLVFGYFAQYLHKKPHFSHCAPFVLEWRSRLLFTCSHSAISAGYTCGHLQNNNYDDLQMVMSCFAKLTFTRKANSFKVFLQRQSSLQE